MKALSAMKSIPYPVSSGERKRELAYVYMQVSFNGRTSASQAENAGSIPVTCSMVLPTPARLYIRASRLVERDKEGASIETSVHPMC